MDEGPGVAVGAFPGTVPAAPGGPDWAVFVPGWLADGEAAGELEVPAAPAPLVVWARARPASARVKVTIRSSFRIRFFLRETVACRMFNHDGMGCGKGALGQKRQGACNSKAAEGLFRAKCRTGLSHPGQKRRRI